MGGAYPGVADFVGVGYDVSAYDGDGVYVVS